MSLIERMSTARIFFFWFCFSFSLNWCSTAHRYGLTNTLDFVSRDSDSGQRNRLDCIYIFFLFFTRLFKLMKIYFEVWILCNFFFAFVLCDAAAMLRRRWNFYWWWDTPAILLALNSRTEIRIHDLFSSALLLFFRVGKGKQIYSYVISHEHAYTGTTVEYISHLLYVETAIEAAATTTTVTIIIAASLRII